MVVLRRRYYENTANRANLRYLILSKHRSFATLAGGESWKRRVERQPRDPVAGVKQVPLEAGGEAAGRQCNF